MTFSWEKFVVKEGESEFPPDWKPEKKGDELNGIITDIREHQDTAIIEVLQGKDDKRTLWVSPVQLKRAIPPLNPQKGDKLVVTYNGKVKLPNGNTMNDYSVSHERASGEEPF